MSVLESIEPKVPAPLVLSVEELVELAEGHADAPGNIVLADVRWYLDGRDARSIYEAGHLPGAVFIDIDRDLSEPSTPTAGRHPLPSPEHFARAMGRSGIGDDTHVIAYDDTGGMTAARLVVMLRALGRSASLLDGGISAWVAAGHGLEHGVSNPRAKVAFTAQVWPDTNFASTEEVLANSKSGSLILIDARPADRFRGDVQSVDPKPGHIPGARNAPWSSALQDGKLRSPAELRAHFTNLGISRNTDVIASCGSGVSACLNVVALEYSGLTKARLFTASWSGWASDPDLPIETGEHRLPRNGSSRDSGKAGVDELRRARRRKRMAEVEWFEALYRVYLAAFIFGGGALFVSGFVRDTPAGESFVDDVFHFGPGWLGLLSVMAVAMGLRSGSRGGPLALEEAEVRHVLLAPVDRRRVLLRPTLQRWRSLVFAAALTGGFAGQLAGRRLPGTELSWAMAGALWGAVAATFFIGAALVSHALRIPRSLATMIGGALIVWQFVSALPAHARLFGPGDATGDLPLWGDRSRASDLFTVIVALAVLGIGVLMLGRQSLEAQSRRAALVTQLRFAVTLQDLRTVLIIRRQLSHEQSRRRPWIRTKHDGGPYGEWQRTMHGLLRFPLSRILRIVSLSSIAGLAGLGVLEGTAPLALVGGVAFFLIGLEMLEPLAQEIDHGDRTDSYPIERGPMYLRLTHASLALSVPLAALWIATIGTLHTQWWAVAGISVLPAITAGLAGAAINIVSGAPDPVASNAQSNLMPPEVAGTANVIKAMWPVLIAVIGQIPLVAAQSAVEKGQGAEAAAVRSAIAVVLVSGLVAAWIHRRDAIRAWMDNAARESRTTSRGVS
jgi:3-mercaptopyruvate sulfurtransferase SseA